jgi:membrane protein implicated in regulation of membrane protease activity
MNKAFLIIAIPAFATSFGWLAFGWGWRVAVVGSAIELAIAAAGVAYLLRRQNARSRGSEASRPEGGS